MGNIIDRAKNRIGQVKADRSTTMGIAGHQAAMKALGTAAGGWERVGFATLAKNGGERTPGQGHVTTIAEDEFSYDGVNKQPMGFQGIAGARLPVKHAQIEPNVIDRHKPTEDF